MKIREICKILYRLLQRQNVLKAEISYLQPDNKLAGKKIIITGGDRGIGKAMAKKFVSEGGKVLITGRNEELLKQTSKELGCIYKQFDVTNYTGFASFLKEADRELGGANVLINNAGISLHEGDIFNVTIESYDKQFAVNLKASYFLAQGFLELLKNNKRGGNILFLSSERSQYVDDIPYGLIKSSINSLTQGLAKSMIRHNIRVNAVAPGITATEMTGRSEDNLLAENYSTGRWYLPEEVAELASFLISDAANCISGQIIYCNNGYSINTYKK